MSAAPRFSLQNINKRFGEVNANSNVNLDIYPNEVIALLGENGAGKSTLMKLLYGFYTPDAGEIVVEGEPLVAHSPKQSLRLGIGMLFQQFNLVPALSVLENLLLAFPAAPWWQWRRRRLTTDVLACLQRIAPDIDPQRLVRDLSVGEQQVVELAKIMALNAQLVILDEPTAVLTPQEVERLYQFVAQCRADGKVVVFITHKLADVRACATRIVVMRQGRIVGDWRTETVTDNELIQAMVGKDTGLIVNRIAPPKHLLPKLMVKRLNVSSRVGTITAMDFEVSPGEVLGIAGVMGNGQRALAMVLAGILVPDSGEVILDGVSINALAHETIKVPDNVAYIPESPLTNAVVAQLDLATNLQLRALDALPFLQWGMPALHEAQHKLAAHDVRPSDPHLSAGALSGGNLQKLVIARELSRPVQLVIACYPTMGLDLIATRNVYERLFAQAEQGACIIWFSEELDDLLRYAHRIMVLHGGRVQSIGPVASFDRQRIGRLMTGHAQAC